MLTSRKTSLVGFGAALAIAGLLLTVQSHRAADAKPAVEIPVVVQDWGDPNGNMQSVIEHTLIPYKGPSHPGVDVSTLTGKIMSGYQGWFTAQGDGAARGWTHFGNRGGFAPGSCVIDYWPDVSELDADERYPTGFLNADGKPAEVFSPHNRKTVLRHFKWMQDYGLDGVWVQRFINDVSSPRGARHVNVVLNHCREGANLYGRTYAVMYDLSGMGGGQMSRVINDWKLLVDKMHITEDPAYQRHLGKPVVSVWGFGFNDGRRYTPDEGMELIKFLKDDPHYGGCTVMLGVPTHWRTLDRDCVNNPVMHELILKADIVSPWTVGRYGTPALATAYAEADLVPDLQWCKDHGKEYLPVVFPGFSWHNMNQRDRSDKIPRLKGNFEWTQVYNAKKAGVTMIYQSMFDEMNEGTSIFKCTETPPVGDPSKFLTFEGLGSDFYLKLVGQAGRMLRGEIALTPEVPKLLTQNAPASPAAKAGQ